MKRHLIAAAIAIVCGSQFVTGAPTLHWKLDETSGTTAADSSGNVFDGIWQGTVGAAGWTPGDGVDGGSVTLSGVDLDTFIIEPFTAIGATPFTMSVWVKSTDTANDGLVYLGNGAVGNEYNILRKQGNVARANIRNPAETNCAGTTLITDGAWHHIVGVYSSTTERQVYVDGVLEGTNTADVADVISTRFGIGALARATPYNPADLLEGQLDDVALWDRAFTAADAAALHGLGVLGAGNAAHVDDLISAYIDQDPIQVAGNDWEYATGLIGAIGTTGGSVASRTAFIVLDDFGTGMRMAALPGNPIVQSFTASPLVVFLGEDVTLAWEVDNATNVSIDEGVGVVANTTGSVVVTPTDTATYTLTASNGNGSSLGEVTITVIAEPVINSFTGAPTSIFAGEQVTLAWDVENFTSLSIDQGVGVVTGALGDTIVTPAATTIYTLTATNATTTSTSMVEVTVFPTPPPRELLLHWPLDEGVGTTTADIAGANPGVFIETGGSPTWTAGLLGGGALSFPNLNGVSVRAATQLVDQYPFSMGGWVKTTAAANDTFAVLGTGVGNQYHSLRVLNGASRIMTRNGGTFELGGPLVNDDAWHYIVGVYSHPASMSLYVDGVFIGERTSDSGDFVLPDRFAIGALDRTDASIVDAYDGSVDDVSFWRGILNPAEVAALHGGATGLGLNASDIDAILSGFEAQQAVEAAGLTWNPVSGLVGLAGMTGGTVAAGNATIALDDLGNGMMAEPPTFRIISISRSSTAVTFEWQSTNAPFYLVEASEDGINWEEVDDNVSPTGATTSFSDTDAVRLAAPTVLYRVRAGS